MSLTLRISLVLALVLAIAGIISSTVLYRKVRKSLRDEIEARLLSRISMLHAAVELENHELVLETAAVRLGTQWSISNHSQLLWSHEVESSATDEPIITITKTVRIGDVGEPDSLQHLQSTSRRIADNGESYPVYQIPADIKGITLRIVASESSAHMNKELNRMAIALWTVNPIAIAVLIAVLWLILRWILLPLGNMARQTAQIGPHTSLHAISEGGTSKECELLRDGVNRMIIRLSEGLQREREFSSIAAHELRTPLAQIRTNLEVTLRRDRNPKEYQAAIIDVLADVDRLQCLVSNLLNVARGEQETQLRPLPLQPLIKRAAQLTADTKIDICIARDEVILGNEELLISAFRNIFENASQYAPGQPATVRCDTNGADVLVTISDGGPGIAEQYRERIFDPLTRLDTARSIKNSSGGLGLGLSVARAAARACRGDLFCRARADREPGAEFVFVLRLANGAEISPHQAG